ncbi:M28 family metallopeptidase, partial [Chloroflexota bacterium]
CDIAAELSVVTTIDELEQVTCKDKILLLKGEICAEQLMPRNFTFYNPDHHKKIYTLLEAKQPAAIIAATTRKPELVGALYPFPLIEDGDFDIPNFFCNEVTGERISVKMRETFRLKAEAERIPAQANNVIARTNPEAEEKIVIFAHIDAYGDSLGASDNASGTAVLLLLAEMFRDYQGSIGIEIIAINGEDNYSAGGEKDYLLRYGNELSKIVVAINLDDIGYIQGKTAYSFYECPETIQQSVQESFQKYEGLVMGERWYQSDHMVFVQKGIPAIALTTEKITELMAGYTHTSRDTPDIVDCGKLVDVARALRDFIIGYTS